LVRFTGGFYGQGILHYEFIPEGKTVKKKCTLIPLVILWIRSEGNAPKNEKETVGFPFTIMFEHTGLFWSMIS